MTKIKEDSTPTADVSEKKLEEKEDLSTSEPQGEPAPITDIIAIQTSPEDKDDTVDVEIQSEIKSDETIKTGGDDDIKVTAQSASSHILGINDISEVSLGDGLLHPHYDTSSYQQQTLIETPAPAPPIFWLGCFEHCGSPVNGIIPAPTIFYWGWDPECPGTPIFFIPSLRAVPPEHQVRLFLQQLQAHCANYLWLVSPKMEMLQKKLDHSKTSDGKEKNAEVINRAQKFLIDSSEPMEIYRNLCHQYMNKSALIIGVDARPHVQAGYLVNLVDRCIHYYVIDRNSFESPTRYTAGDSAEFEMKNFMFALMFWKTYIKIFRYISIYTDNFAIGRNYDPQQFGSKAAEMLYHFIEQEKVVVRNEWDRAVNKYNDLWKFAQFIQPADDLTRGMEVRCLEFLMYTYEIPEGHVHGSYLVKQRGSCWYENNLNILNLIRTVDEYCAIGSPFPGPDPVKRSASTERLGKMTNRKRRRRIIKG